MYKALQTFSKFLSEPDGLGQVTRLNYAVLLRGQIRLSAACIHILGVLNPF